MLRESDDETQQMINHAETERENETENRPANRRRRYRLTAQQRRTARAFDGRAPRELTEAEIERLQSQENSQTHESQLQAQRKDANDITQLDSRLNQLRHDFRETMVESTLALQSVMQEVRGHGPRLDRLSHVVYHVVRDRLDGFEFRLQLTEGFVHKVVTETDRRSHDMCTSRR